MYFLDKSEESEESVYDKHLTYKVKKGDTLQSVADELGVDAYELRRYHNIYCPLPDLIEADFKSYLKFVILASEETKTKRKEEILKKSKKVIFGSDYRIPFIAEKITESYKVKYTIEVDSVVNETEIIIDVRWLATDKNKYHLFEINRGNEIYVNGLPPDSMISELGAKTAEVLYPLKIVVDEFGEWIDIYNYDEIESRWEIIKKEVLDYYEGELTEAYIDSIERTLRSSDTLLKSLRSDYFLRTFFSGIHVKYTADYSFKNEISFPLENEEEAIFEVQQKISPILEDSDFIKIEQKGHYVDSLSHSILYGYTSSKVKYRSSYSLNSETYALEKMNVECHIESNEYERKTIVIETFLQEKKKTI